jgi:hypothetical protein
MNSGNADAGDGGVAVAATLGLSGETSAGRTAPDVSMERLGVGDGGAARRGDVDESPRSTGCAKPAVSQPLCVGCGV